MATFFVVVVSCTMLGCEEAVFPIVGEERPYTIWGLFDAGADTQKVRVFEINDFPGFEDDHELDATVVSTNLTTGETRVWHHRRRVDESGDVRHVFWSAFRAERGHSYRLEVRRSDGAVSSATATVPDEVEIDFDPSTTDVAFPVFIQAPNVFGVAMRYEATNVPPIEWPPGMPEPPTVDYAVEVPYDGKGLWTSSGWRFSIDMVADAEKVRAEYERNCLINEENPNIALRRVELHFIAANEEWRPPGGIFDPEVLIAPGTFSNVENGFGFIGAGEIVRIRWTPDPAVREFLGYGYDQTPESDEPPIPCIGENPLDVWDIYF